MTESTEPRTAAHKTIADFLAWYINHFEEIPARRPDGVHDRECNAADELLRRLATITPTEPGRVVISVEAAGCAKRALDDYLMAADIDYNYDAEQDARDEIAVAIAAADRAATGGNDE